jgi:hypothetical protein
MTVDSRTVALLDYYIRKFEALHPALDQLLAGPRPYSDPEILPDSQSPDDFCTCYQTLRDGAARDLSATIGPSLPTRQFQVTRGLEFPIQGCLLRQDMESMRLDVKACIAALRSLRGSTLGGDHRDGNHHGPTK